MEDHPPSAGSGGGTGLLSSIEKARQRQAAQRAAHLEWKQRFFLSRPPPPARERLHRLNHHEGRYRGSHTAFAIAQSLHRSELSHQEEETKAPVPECSDALPTASASASSDAPQQRGTTEEGEPLSRQVEDTASRRDRWLQQMASERARRLPCADIQIRSDPLRTVVVAHLPPTVVEEELRRFANQFGRVTQCRVVHSKTTGRSRGYGFVEFGLRAEARTAASQSRRKRLGGRVVSIEMERGRVDAQFLPKRLAAAAAVEAQLVRADQTSRKRKERGDGKELEPHDGAATRVMKAREDDELDERAKKRAAPEHCRGDSDAVEAKGGVDSALAILSIEAENEDDYLNAILNAGL